MKIHIKRVLSVTALMLCLFTQGYGQFKENVRQSYLCYNKARMAMAGGKKDSAAIYMQQSLLLNNQIAWIRYEAWEIFMKAGRYLEALADINSFYRNKLLPDDMMGYFFSSLDSATFALAKKDKEIRLFIAGYDSLKLAHKKFYNQSNPFKELVSKCHYIDQFAREYAMSLENSGDTAKTPARLKEYSRIIEYADKENIREIGEYLKSHSLPASSDDPTVEESACFVLFLHWIRDTAAYKNYAGWQTIHDSVLKNVYDGKYDVRSYVRILESQHFVFTKKFAFGIWSNGAPTPGHPKMRKLQADIDDIAHVDQRRQEWLQPTLYDDYVINDQELQMPAGYEKL